MKTALRLIASLLLSGVFLWLAFRKVDVDAMLDQLVVVDGAYVLIYVGSVLVIQACRIFRWDVLVRPFVHLNLRQLLRVSNLGMMLVVLLPLRLGEFARPYLMKQEAGAPMSAGLGAAAVERTIDGLLVTVLFFVTTLWLEPPYEVPTAVRGAAYLSLAVFTGATVVIVGALVSGSAMSRLIRRLGMPLSEKLTLRAIGMLESFVCGLRALPDVRAIGLFVVYTLVYWGMNGLGMYCVMLGFGWELPLVSGFLVVCILVLGIMIPAGPGFLGTFQAAIVMGLAIFKVGATEAAAYAMVIYPVNVAVVVSLGLPYLFGRGPTLKGMVSASREAGGEAATEAP